MIFVLSWLKNLVKSSVKSNCSQTARQYQPKSFINTVQFVLTFLNYFIFTRLQFEKMTRKLVCENFSQKKPTDNLLLFLCLYVMSADSVQPSKCAANFVQLIILEIGQAYVFLMNFTLC